MDVPKSAYNKTIYCSVCDKWLSEGCIVRHIRCHTHRQKKQKMVCDNKKQKNKAVEMTSTPEKSENDKAYEHYRIEDHTIKKCPHEHKSILLEGCSYFEKTESSPEKGVFESARQLRFDKECEFAQKNGYDGDVPQTLEVDWDWLGEENNNPSSNPEKTESTLNVGENQTECIDFHDNQLGYLKCSVCNPADYTHWEEY